MIYLFLFLLPIQLGTFFFLPESFIGGIRIDYLAPALYLTDIVTIILIVLNHKLILKTPFFRNFGYWKLVIISIIAVNTFFAIEPLIAWNRVFKILEAMAIFVIIKDWKPNWSHVLLAFLMGAVLQLGLVIFQVTQGQSMQGFAYFLGERAFSLSTPGIAKVSLQGIEILRGYGTFPHPNALAGFYLLLYTFFLFSKWKSCHPELDSGSNLKKISGFRTVPAGRQVGVRNDNVSPFVRTLFLALCTLLILFSFSKIAIATLVIVTILFVMREKYDCLLCGFSKIVIPIFLALIVFSTQGDAESIEKRMYLAQSSLTIIKDHPMTGVGMGNYLYAQAAFPIPYNYVFLQPVHNIFLLTISEMGVPFALVIAYLFFRYFRSKKDIFVIRNSTLIILSVIFMTGMLDHYWLTIQQNILLIPVVFGLLQRHDHVVK